MGWITEGVVEKDVQCTQKTKLVFQNELEALYRGYFTSYFNGIY